MSYTYAAARNRDGARVNTRVPTRMFQLVTKYQLTGALKGLSIGGGVDWKNDNPVSGVMEDIGQSGHALVNLMARYQFSSNVSAAVNINNLFDRHYYSQIGFYNQGWYGAPRNVMFTLKVGY